MLRALALLRATEQVAMPQSTPSLRSLFPAPLHTAPRELLAGIRLLATDIDGTMTHDGRLDPGILPALLRLESVGIEVMPVTGRPAGEALGLARYLPTIRRAVAENGATLVSPDLPVRWLGQQPDRARLLAVAEQLGRAGRPWTLAPDAFCRLADIAWLREDRTDAELEPLRALATAHGVHLIWSSVHIHLADSPPDKGAAVQQIAAELGYAAHEIATIGDAPNDVGLWHSGRFGLTVGTAQVLDQLEVLEYKPMWVTSHGAAGWLELANQLCAARG